MSSRFISTGQQLRQGDVLTSEDGNVKAVFQHDGNFVIYKSSSTPTWHSNTVCDRPYRIVLLEDNNLVMYSKANKPLWATDTYCNQTSERMRLTVTNEGTLVLDRDGGTIWTSGK
ncbi:B-type lectin plumieribetin-like [Lampris incognitus]|uniref:B-type lectin plumieribetin-like n=1 Tax=Lampris incognitus TaxID=2546036 RepID=UPI0024B5AD66|nr:B-type lectin plumieribetin-like [Lampris incognitus]